MHDTSINVKKKQCSKCKLIKVLTEFHRQVEGKFGRRADCINCRGFNKRIKRSVEEKKANKSAYHKIWRTKNKEHLRSYRSYYRIQRKTDVEHKLACNLRQRVSKALKQNRKPGSAVKDLGCTVEELKQHLEAQFQPGMTWDNWSYYGWHIDHIKPLASFDLTDRMQFLEACHYTNLQPLWASVNFKKNKY